MRIEQIGVDGFGLLHDKAIEPAPGLTVVRGLNEAGKTTLLAFVRAMLFGFETRRYAAMAGGRRGGRLGVRMADGRFLKVERYGERGGSGTLKVFGEDGVDRGSDELARLLQGVDGPLFRNVFAFGLSELASFEDLKGEQISARIYGAGLGLGLVSAVDIEKRLGAGASELFSSGASKKRVNQLLGELEDVEKVIKGRNLPVEYEQTVSSLGDAERRRDDLAARLAVLDDEQRRYDRERKAWGAWIDLQAARSEREGFGEVAPLPANLEAALATAETRLDEARTRRDGAQLGLDDQRETLAAIVVDPAAGARIDDLGVLAGDAIRDRERRKELDTVRADATAIDRELAAAIERLGPGWTEDRVEAFDDSLGVESVINGRFRDSLDRASEGLRTAKASQAQIARERAGLERDRDGLAVQVETLVAEAPDQPSAEALERRLRDVEAAVAAARIAGEQAERAATAAVEARRAVPVAPAGRGWPEVAADAAALRAAMAESALLASVAMPVPVPVGATGGATGGPAGAGLTGGAGSAGAGPTAAGPVGTAPATPWAAVGIGIVGIIGAIVLAVIGQVMAAAAVLVMALVAAGAVWWALRRPPVVIERGTQATSAAATAAAAAVAAAAEANARRAASVAGQQTMLCRRLSLADDAGPDAVAEIERQCTAAGRAGDGAALLEEASARAAADVTRATDALAVVAAAAGLPAKPSREDLDAASAVLAGVRDRAARLRGLREQIDAIAVRLETRGQELVAAEAEVVAADAALAAARTEWSDWLAERGFDRTLDRDTASRMITAISAAKAPLRKRVSTRARGDELRAAHEEFVAVAVALASEIGVPSEGVDRDVAALERMLGALDDVRARTAAATGKRDEADRACRRLDQLLEAAELGLVTAEETLAAILAEFGADDASALRAVIGRAGEAARLDDRIAAATTALQMLSGTGAGFGRLLEDLASIEDVVEVEADYARVEVAITDARAAHDELSEQVGNLRNTVERYEKDASASEALQRKADLQARLEVTSREWTTFVLARHLLATARHAYEGEHRPAVIRIAEQYFTEWTRGRYRRILAPIGSQIEAVEHVDGTNVAIEDLSTGTAQQLYLAIRFGLLEHFAQNAEPLPVVMDDILVNFDDERAALAAESIRELAKRQQVLYFTCHPEIPLKGDLEIEMPRLKTVADAQSEDGTE
ncbi:MAG: AAA family ATPase [Chloroflexota bacterium]